MGRRGSEKGSDSSFEIHRKRGGSNKCTDINEDHTYLLRVHQGAGEVWFPLIFLRRHSPTLQFRSPGYGTTNSLFSPYPCTPHIHSPSNLLRPQEVWTWSQLSPPFPHPGFIETITKMLPRALCLPSPPVASSAGSEPSNSHHTLVHCFWVSSMPFPFILSTYNRLGQEDGVPEVVSHPLTGFPSFYVPDNSHQGLLEHWEIAPFSKTVLGQFCWLRKKIKL